jgi:hypothetical protein
MTIPELPNFIDLKDSDINWTKFHNQIVVLLEEVKKYTSTKKINLKTHDTALSLKKQLEGPVRDLDDVIHDELMTVVELVQRLENFNETQYIDYEKNTDSFISILDDTKFQYIKETLEEIQAITKIDFRMIKCATMFPHTMYDFHIDSSFVAYHLPIITTIPDCFFIEGNAAYVMNDTKKLYKLNTGVLHSAFNASRKKRLHLLFAPKNLEIINPKSISNENFLLYRDEIIEKANNKLSQISKTEFLYNKDFYTTVGNAIKKLKNC